MFKQIAFAAIFIIALANAATAQERSNFTTSGVRNSAGTHQLNEKQLQMVRESLQQKSGFVELGFDQEGTMTLGNRENIAGGSVTARALLEKAVDSANLYELESHESSPEIAFARIVESEDRQTDATSVQTTIHQVQLDFADFNRLSGAPEAKAALDIGLALLHEFLKLQDPSGGTDQIGKCDAHVNQMRRELQLPERLYYNPDITLVELNGRRIVSARLVFVERAAANAQPNKQYSLSWFTSQVSPNAQNIAGLQQGLLAARRR
jgi:hypothetical protein